MTDGSARPHLGLILPNYGAHLDAGVLAQSATAAEESGFDSAWVTDHIMVPPEHASVYGTITEALASLGYLIGHTRTLQLGVSALIVPQRHPLLTLKQLTSLDFLSGGRVVTAVGAGWMEGEFEQLGISYADRGKRLDAWLDLARSAFAQMPGPIQHHGPPAIAGSWLAPGLVRPGGPELWVAGVSRATLRRAAKTGVWHPVALTTHELERMAAEFRDRRNDGRVVLRIGVYLTAEPVPDANDERGRHAIAGPPGWIAERLNDYVSVGCDGFVINLDHERPGLDDRVRRFAAEVVPLLTGARR